MKKLLFLVLVAILMGGCSFEPKVEPIYSLELSVDVTYMNGDEDALTFECDSMYKDEVSVFLKEGDLKVQHYPIYKEYNKDNFITYFSQNAISSGVRKFTVTKQKVTLINKYELEN